jgi:hypothetical protein
MQQANLLGVMPVQSPFHENSKHFLALSINLIAVSRLVASALPAQVSL